MKIAIIGLGAMGKTHYAMLKQHTSNPAEIICDLDTDKLEEIDAKVKTKDPSEAIKLADAVIIASPTHTHTELALEALTTHKPVFCEKPLARSLVGAKEILTAVRREKVPFQVGYIMRFSEVWKQIKTMMSHIGTPIFWREIWHINGQLYPNWLQTSEGGGPIFEDSHRFEFLCSALGKPLAAYGYITSFTPKFQDTFLVELQFERGRAVWSDSWARTSPGSSNREPRIVFDAIGPTGHIVHPVHGNWTNLYDVTGKELDSIQWDHLGISGYHKEMQAFLRYVGGGKNEGCTVEEATQVIALIEAIIESSQKGQVVAIEAIN